MKKENHKYEIDMCNGPILGKMLKFTIPLMCSGVLQLLFNAADIVVVGRFAGDNSMAAVGSTSSLINLLTNLFIGLSVGSNVLTARYFSSKQNEELEKTVHTSIVLGFISGIILSIIGCFGARQILIWMSTPVNVLPLATNYMRIYFLGMAANMLYNFGSAILRAIGDTKRPLFYLSIAGVINVLLNLVFVILFKMDVAGVAVATVISQIISAVLVIRCLLREQGPIRLYLSKLRIDWKKLKDISKIGLPAGIQGVIFSLSNVVIQSSVNSFGEIVVAGNSAAASLEGFVYVCMNAFYQATISFTSQNYGVGNCKRINQILIRALICVAITGIVFGNLVVLAGNPLLSIYSKSESVVAAGLTRLSMICSTYALCGMMDVMVGALRGIGYSIMPMIVSLIGACGFRLVWIATIFRIPDYHSIRTVYFSYPLSWALTFLVHLLCYCIVKKKLDTKLSYNEKNQKNKLNAF